MTHGYNAYTHGCRCDECRKGKADYMRARRAAARRLANTNEPADIERHGTRYGYEERGCRCPECLAARATLDRKRWPRRAARLDARWIREGVA